MKFAALALTFLGLANDAQAYKIKKWNDMLEKQPISTKSYHELRKYYELIYTLGWTALKDASAEDDFDVRGKFGIELTKESENLGFKGLAEFQTSVDEKDEKVNEDEESVAKFRDLCQDLEQELLLMNAALAYSAGFMDKIDSEKAQLLRDAREDFKSQAQAFEKDQLWAARSWNRVWKKQGLPAKGYAILEEKLDQRIRDFEEISAKIFRHGAGEPDDFKSDEKIAEIRTAVANMFKSGADQATLETALEVVNAKWREFSSAFVSSNMVASQSAEYNFEEEY